MDSTDRREKRPQVDASHARKHWNRRAPARGNDGVRTRSTFSSGIALERPKTPHARCPFRRHVRGLREGATRILAIGSAHWNHRRRLYIPSYIHAGWWYAQYAIIPHRGVIDHHSSEPLTQNAFASPMTENTPNPIRLTQKSRWVLQIGAPAPAPTRAYCTLTILVLVVLSNR